MDSNQFYDKNIRQRHTRKRCILRRSHRILWPNVMGRALQIAPPCYPRWENMEWVEVRSWRTWKTWKTRRTGKRWKTSTRWIQIPYSWFKTLYFVTQNTLIVKLMTQNILRYLWRWLKNHNINIQAWRTWSWVSSRWENIKRNAELWLWLSLPQSD